MVNNEPRELADLRNLSPAPRQPDPGAKWGEMHDDLWARDHPPRLPAGDPLPRPEPATRIPDAGLTRGLRLPPRVQEAEVLRDERGLTVGEAST